MARDVLDLVGERPAVGLPQPGQHVGQGRSRDGNPKHPRRHLRLQLRCQARDQVLRIERGIARRLGAERIEMRREMPVHPVCLDERHRGRDGPEQNVRRLGSRRRLCLRPLGGSRCSRLGRGGALDRDCSGELLQPVDGRVTVDEAVLGVLEELAPFRVDRLGRGEILVEEVSDVAEVDVVDAFRGHGAWPPVHLSEFGALRPIGSVKRASGRGGRPPRWRSHGRRVRASVGGHRAPRPRCPPLARPARAPVGRAHR